MWASSWKDACNVPGGTRTKYMQLLLALTHGFVGHHRPTELYRAIFTQHSRYSGSDFPSISLPHPTIAPILPLVSRHIGTRRHSPGAQFPPLDLNQLSRTNRIACFSRFSCPPCCAIAPLPSSLQFTPSQTLRRKNYFEKCLKHGISLPKPRRPK